MSDPEYDTGELPKFDKLREALNGSPSREAILGWVDKLEGWCKQAQADLSDSEEKLRAEIEALDDANVRLQAELAEARVDVDALENLKDRILDVERGICTPQELHLEVRSLG